MWARYRVEILAIVAILCCCGIFLYSSVLLGDAEYAGSDTIGSSRVAELAGVSEEDFQPLIDAEKRVLGAVPRDGDNQSVANLLRSLDYIKMTICQGIKGPRINSNSHKSFQALI